MNPAESLLKAEEMVRLMVASDYLISFKIATESNIDLALSEIHIGMCV